MHAHTMISSSSVAMIPPWTTCLKPMCSGRGVKRVRTTLPVRLKAEIEPDGIRFAANEARMRVRQFFHARQ